MKNVFSNYKISKFFILSLFLFSAINLFAQCKESRIADSLILIKLYNETNGQDWKNKDGWLETNIDFWYGITTTTDGCKVEKIDLPLNELNGKLPSDLNQLIELRYLDVRANTLNGKLPDYSQQENITHLNFNLNEFNGKLPNYENLNNLTFFACAFNKLSGNLPDISNLVNLQHFNICHNEITGSYPNIKKLNNLQLFFIQVNQIKGEFNNLAEIENLREFSMSHNPITVNLNTLIKTSAASRITNQPEEYSVPVFDPPVVAFEPPVVAFDPPVVAFVPPVVASNVIDLDPRNSEDLQAITLNHPDFNNLPDIMPFVKNGTFNYNLRSSSNAISFASANTQNFEGSNAQIIKLKKDGSEELTKQIKLVDNNLESTIGNLAKGFYNIAIGSKRYKLIIK